MINEVSSSKIALSKQLSNVNQSINDQQSRVDSLRSKYDDQDIVSYYVSFFINYTGILTYNAN